MKNILLALILISSTFFLSACAKESNPQEEDANFEITFVEPSIEPIIGDNENFQQVIDTNVLLEESFLKLSKLQDEYEVLYKEVGDQAHPRYGSLMREIDTINKSLPKFSSEMTQNERNLLRATSEYGNALFFTTPQADKLDGIDYATEMKQEVELLIKNKVEISN